MFVQASTLSVARLDLELGKVSIQYSTEPTNRGVQRVGYFKNFEVHSQCGMYNDWALLSPPTLDCVSLPPPVAHFIVHHVLGVKRLWLVNC